MKRKLAILSATVLALFLLGCTTALAQATSKPTRSAYDIEKTAVCYYFGSYCSQAMTVSACETGHTFSVWSKNGQYLGIFQMGKHEREKYGHGNNVWAQAKAAHAYFIDSGRDWSPWECKPY